MIEVGDIVPRVGVTEMIEVGDVDLRVNVTEMIEVGGICPLVSATEVFTDFEYDFLKYDYLASEPPTDGCTTVNLYSAVWTSMLD